MEQPKYILDEQFADNGEHSHWNLIESKTGKVVWSEHSVNQVTMEQYRNRPKHLCSLENDELIQVCTQWIQRLIDSGGREWSLNIPARPNSDPDLVLTELVERFKEMQEPVSAPSVPVLQKDQLTDLRNSFYDEMPSSGEIKAWDMIEWASAMFRKFDEFIDALPAPEVRQIAGVQWVSVKDRFPSEEGWYVTKGVIGSGYCWFNNGEIKDSRGNEIIIGPQIFWLDESGSSLSTAKEQPDWQKMHKEANQFILDLAKEFGEDSLGFDGIQWSIEDFKEAAKKRAAAKEQETANIVIVNATAIAFAYWLAKVAQKIELNTVVIEGVHRSYSAAYDLFLQSQTK